VADARACSTALGGEPLDELFEGGGEQVAGVFVLDSTGPVLALRDGFPQAAPSSGSYRRNLSGHAATAEVLEDGGRGFVLDADRNGAEQVAGRFLSLGVPEAVLADPPAGRARPDMPDFGPDQREA
jgi:hypothetical protein